MSRGQLVAGKTCEGTTCCGDKLLRGQLVNLLRWQLVEGTNRVGTICYESTNSSRERFPCRLTCTWMPWLPGSEQSILDVSWGRWWRGCGAAAGSRAAAPATRLTRSWRGQVGTPSHRTWWTRAALRWSASLHSYINFILKHYKISFEDIVLWGIVLGSIPWPFEEVSARRKFNGEKLEM